MTANDSSRGLIKIWGYEAGWYFFRAFAYSGWGSIFGTPKLPIFWNFEFSSIKRTKDELFDVITLEFIFDLNICLNSSNIQNIWKFIELEIYGILIDF